MGIFENLTKQETQMSFLKIDNKGYFGLQECLEEINREEYNKEFPNHKYTAYIPHGYPVNSLLSNDTAYMISLMIVGGNKDEKTILENVGLPYTQSNAALIRRIANKSAYSAISDQVFKESIDMENSSQYKTKIIESHIEEIIDIILKDPYDYNAMGSKLGINLDKLEQRAIQDIIKGFRCPEIKQKYGLQNYVKIDRSDEYKLIDLNNTKIINISEIEYAVSVVNDIIVPNTYFISNLGNLYKNQNNSLVKCITFERNGYMRANLRTREPRGTNGDNRYKASLHILVATAFIEFPERLKGLSSVVVNHKDSNRANNCIENLEWVLQKENVAHAMASGGIAKSKHEDFAIKVCEQLVSQQYPTTKSICDAIGLYNATEVEKKLIRKIASKVGLTSISDKYFEGRISLNNPRATIVYE